MEQLKINKKGFSTIELMIAMGIMALVLTAVVMTSFGSQSFLISSQTSAEAMKIAQGLIEEQQALARKDFNLVNNIADTVQDIYTKSLSVKLKDDFLTKEVTAKVTYNDERGIERTTELVTLIANFDGAVGGNTCDSNLSGDWSNPILEDSTSFSSISPSGTYKLSDVDAYLNKLYVTASSTTGIADPTLFSFDVDDISDTPGKVDNATAVTSGLNAVRVSKDPITGNTYAYTASNTASSYTLCNPTTDSACGQLVIFNVTNFNPVKNANLKITSTPLITGQNTGTSIFYKNGYILLGLATNSTGPEFHLIDVHNPNTIINGSRLSIGSFEIGNDINAVNMRDTYAYIASPNTSELKILNLIDPTCPIATCLVGSFSTGSGNGKSMQLVGDKLYFGRTTDLGTGEDFQILNNSNPSTTLVEHGGIDIGDSVNKIIVRDYLTFLLTNNDLKIFNTLDPSNITLFGSYTLPGTYNSSYPKPSMDCEGNRIFITSNNESGQGSVYIIKSSP